MTETAHLVQTIFNFYFADSPDAEGLLSALMAYRGNEPDRVRLAVLKLSEGDPQKLRHNLDAARIDYRDVLAWAEYPEQLRSGKSRYNSPEHEYEAILRADRQQYEDWLDEHRPLDPKNRIGNGRLNEHD